MTRHPLDILSLIAGLLFTGMAVAYLVGAYTDLRLDPNMAVPLAVVGLGLVGVAGSVLRQRSADRGTTGRDEVADRPA